MSALFVTATGTDIGKTFVTAALLRHLHARGVAASALKPVMSGYDPARPAESDAGALVAAMGRAPDEAAVMTIAPWRFAAPLSPDMAARREGRRLPIRDIEAFCRARVAATAAPLLIEGVGGVMSPIAEDATCLDLVAALGAPALVIGGVYLGAISHALTALEALARRGAACVAFVVNETPGSAVDFDETRASLARFAPTTPILPLRRADANGADLDAIARAAGLLA